MKAVILKCHEGSRFHFGTYAPDSDTALERSSEIFHSDTLYSGMINSYVDLYQDPSALLTAFEKGQLLISSGFLYIHLFKDDTEVFFLPKPIVLNTLKAKERKLIKSIRFISLGIWNLLHTPDEFLNLLEKDQILLLQHRTYACLRSEFSSSAKLKDPLLIHQSLMTKVRVRSSSEKGNLHQLNTVEPISTEDYECHFYFLLKINGLETTLESKFRNMLSYLCERGIGGEISTIGHFDSFVEKEWNEVDSVFPQTECTLSLFSPSPADLNKLVGYQTIFRGGRRLGVNGQALLSLRMIEEGAVVRPGVSGCIHDISPDSNKYGPYFRYGKPITIPIPSLWNSK